MKYYFIPTFTADARGSKLGCRITDKEENIYQSSLIAAQKMEDGTVAQLEMQGIEGYPGLLPRLSERNGEVERDTHGGGGLKPTTLGEQRIQESKENPFSWFAPKAYKADTVVDLDGQRCKAGDRASYFNGQYKDFSDALVAYGLAIQSCLKTNQYAKNQHDFNTNIKQVTKGLIDHVITLYIKNFTTKPSRVRRSDTGGRLDQIHFYSAPGEECPIKTEERIAKDKQEVVKICQMIKDNFLKSFQVVAEEGEIDIGGKSTSYTHKYKGGTLDIPLENLYLDRFREQFIKYFRQQTSRAEERGVDTRNEILCKDAKVPSPKEFLAQAMLTILQVVDDAPWKVGGINKGHIGGILNQVYDQFLEESKSIFQLNQTINFIGYESNKEPDKMIPAFAQEMEIIKGKDGNIYVVNKTQKDFFELLQQDRDTKVPFIAATGTGKSTALEYTEAITGHTTILLPYPINKQKYDTEWTKLASIQEGEKVVIVVDDKSSISETYSSDHQREDYHDYIMDFMRQAYILGSRKGFKIREAHIGATVADVSSYETRRIDHGVELNGDQIGRFRGKQQTFEIKRVIDNSKPVEYIKNILNTSATKPTDKIKALFFPELDKPLMQRLFSAVGDNGVIYLNDKLLKGWELKDGWVAELSFKSKEELTKFVDEKRRIQLAQGKDITYVFDSQNYLGADLPHNELIGDMHIIEYGPHSTFNSSVLEQFRGRKRTIEDKVVTLHSPDRDLFRSARKNSEILDTRYKIKFLKPLWKAICTPSGAQDFNAQTYIAFKNAILNGGYDGLVEFFNKYNKSLNIELYHKYADSREGKEELQKQCDLYQGWYNGQGRKKHSLEVKESVYSARSHILNTLQHIPPEEKTRLNDKYKQDLLKEDQYRAYQLDQELQRERQGHLDEVSHLKSDFDGERQDAIQQARQLRSEISALTQQKDGLTGSCRKLKEDLESIKEQEALAREQLRMKEQELGRERVSRTQLGRELEAARAAVIAVEERFRLRKEEFGRELGVERDGHTQLGRELEGAREALRLAEERFRLREEEFGRELGGERDGRAQLGRELEGAREALRLAEERFRMREGELEGELVRGLDGRTQLGRELEAARLELEEETQGRDGDARKLGIEIVDLARDRKFLEERVRQAEDDLSQIDDQLYNYMLELEGKNRELAAARQEHTYDVARLEAAQEEANQEHISQLKTQQESAGWYHAQAEQKHQEDRHTLLQKNDRIKKLLLESEERLGKLSDYAGLQSEGRDLRQRQEPSPLIQPSMHLQRPSRADVARGEGESKQDNSVMIRNLALSVLMVVSIGVTVAGFLTVAGVAATFLQMGGIVGIIASLMCATVNNYDYLHKNRSRSQGEISRQEFMEVSALGTEERKRQDTWVNKINPDQVIKEGNHAAIVRESQLTESTITIH